MTRPCFDSVTSLIIIFCGGFTQDASTDTSDSLREFKQIFLLISIKVLTKAVTQCESVVTYIKSCLIFQIARFMRISKYRVISPLSIPLSIRCLFRINPKCHTQNDTVVTQNCSVKLNFVHSK